MAPTWHFCKYGPYFSNHIRTGKVKIVSKRAEPAAYLGCRACCFGYGGKQAKWIYNKGENFRFAKRSFDIDEIPEHVLEGVASLLVENTEALR